MEEWKKSVAIRNRTIYLTDDITNESMVEFCYNLDRIVEYDKVMNTPINELKPIYITIKSGGGNVYDVLGAIGKLESLMNNGYTVISTIESYAMSAAQLLAMVANERRSYAHSRIMIHQISSGIMGTLKDMESATNEIQILWDKFKEIVFKYSDIDEEFLNEIRRCNNNNFMWPEKALELGIIDKII